MHMSSYSPMHWHQTISYMALGTLLPPTKCKQPSTKYFFVRVALTDLHRHNEETHQREFKASRTREQSYCKVFSSVPGGHLYIQKTTPYTPSCTGSQYRYPQRAKSFSIRNDIETTASEVPGSTSAEYLNTLSALSFLFCDLSYRTQQVERVYNTIRHPNFDANHFPSQLNLCNIVHELYAQ